MTKSFANQRFCKRSNLVGFVAKNLSSVLQIMILILANCLAVALLASDAEDAAPGALLKPWTDATAKFLKSRETAKEGLIRLLDAAEEKARAAGDLEKVKTVQQERARIRARPDTSQVR